MALAPTQAPATAPAVKAAAPTAAPAAKAQTIPDGAPVPAPAAPAAKAPRPSKKAVDLSNLSPEQRARFEALTAQIDSDKKKLNETKRAQDELLGITPAKRARTAGTPSLGGLHGDIMVTVDTQGTGFKNAEDVAIAQKIGNGKSLKEVIAMEGVDFNWVRHRHIRNSLKLNGMTYVESINKAAGLPTAPAASTAETQSAA